MTRFQEGLVAVLVLACTAMGVRADVADAIATIKAVDHAGKGHKAAVAAVQELSKAPAAELPVILTAMTGANPLATNWLAGAFETIADRELKKGGKLPADALEKFVRDTKQDAAARRLAYEWLRKVDPAAEDRLIPGMLKDPGSAFRRDAVQRLITAAEARLAADEKESAKAGFQEALQGATDDDQVKAIVKPLKELGVDVDLQQHFGFLTHWKLIAPFNNVGLVGFDTVYPPEKELNFDAKYVGMEDKDVAWTDHATTDEYGVVNLAKALSPFKGAVSYAATEFNASKAELVELRLGTPNAWKLWVNGELAFARDEYHRGTRLDQYKVQVHLKPGPNVILLKVCQNEQTEDWAQDWNFQLRVSDSSGAAILPAADKVSAATK